MQKLGRYDDTYQAQAVSMPQGSGEMDIKDISWIMFALKLSAVCCEVGQRACLCRAAQSNELVSKALPTYPTEYA